MNAVAYCRVSTIEQSTEGASLGMQQERIHAWCTANGFTQEAVFVETMSGSRASNRPELLNALSRVCKIQGVLVVFSLSRLARSLKDTILISERLERAGANLASLTERIDTTSAMGKMVFRLLSTLNEFERDQLSERTECAMNHLRRVNRRISAKIPVGYDLNPDGRTLAANASEQALISRICDERSRGVTLRAIAAGLNEAGKPAKNGGQWRASSVHGILKRLQKLAA